MTAKSRALRGTMEKSRKHVDRQATFETDSRTKKGNLKLPVIDSKDELVTVSNNSNAKRQPLNVKSKSRAIEQTREKEDSGGTTVHSSKNGHSLDSNQSQSSPKVSKGGNAKVQQTVPKQKPESHVVANTKSNKEKSSKIAAVNSSNINSVPAATTGNNNVHKSTSLSKSLEAKLSRKESTDKAGNTVNIKSKGNNTVDSPRNVDIKSSNNDERTARASVLNKVNRNRSKSPSKRDASPEKKVLDNSNKSTNDQINNKSSIKTSQVQKPAFGGDQVKKDQKSEKNDVKLNTESSKSKASVSPRRTANNSRALSEKGDDSISYSGSTAPSETHPTKTVKGKSPSRDPAKSTVSENHNQNLNSSSDANKLKTKTLNTPSPNYKNSSGDRSRSRSPELRNTSGDRNSHSDVKNVGAVSVTLTDSQKHTYVLSPASTKLDSKYTPSRSSRLDRLSPTNETVEPIKLEQRRNIDKPKMDGRESYEQLYAERITLLNAEHAYKKRIKQLEDEANGFLKAIEELTHENRYLRDKSDHNGDMLVRGKGDSVQSEKLEALERENLKLTNRVKDLQHQVNSAANENDLRDLKSQVVKLQSENQNVNAENAELRSKNEESMKKLKALETEKKSLETSVTAVESEKLDKINDLHKEHKELTKQLKDSHTKTKQLEKKIEALGYENQALSDLLEQKKSELNEILGVMKDENKFDNEIKDLKNQILKLNKDKKEIEMNKNKEKRIISDKLEETMKTLEKLTGELDELKIKYDQADKEKRKLKSDLTPMKKKCEDLGGQVDQLKEQAEMLQNQLKESNAKYTRLLSDTKNAAKDLTGTKEKLETLNKELQAIVSDKESQISKLINQLDSLREERENDKKSLKEEKEKAATEMEKIEQYQTTNRRLEGELKHYMEKLDESRLKEKQLELQLEDKTFQLSNLEQQVFEMNVKLDNNSKRMSDLDREKREMEREKREWDVKKDKLDDIEASNKRLLEENKRLRNQLEISSYVSTRPTDRVHDDKAIVEAWVSDKGSAQTAIYVTKDRDRKRVHIVQPNIQKKRQGVGKSSPTKQTKQSSNRKLDNKSKSPSRSLEDIRNAITPVSEHSLPELNRDARMTVGYGAFGGYREIHKDRIRAAHKKVY